MKLIAFILEGSFLIRIKPIINTLNLIWQDWRNPRRDAVWQTEAERGGPSPYKAGGSPFDSMPDGQNPKKAIIDCAHTFHIKGIGCDFCASGLLLCARKGVFGAGKLDDQLKQGYELFMRYCHAKGKTTSIRHWDGIQELGMGTQKQFPTTISGKGFDTGIVCGFLGNILAEKVL